MDRDTKKAYKKRYQHLRSAVTAALNRADPIGLLSMGAPKDEYDPEVGTILLRLRHVSSADDVQRVLHEEFTRWFGADIAGVPHVYRGAAEEIWRAMRHEDAVS